MQPFLNHKATAALLPAIVGLGGAALSVGAFDQYGWSLFLGLPIVVGFLSAFSWCFKRKKTFSSTYVVSCLSVLALGGLILVIALDGVICLLMALPLAMVLAMIGATLGRIAGSSFGGPAGASIVSLLAVSFPFLVAFDDATAPKPAIREVSTSVVIDASIEDVWNTVIAFPEITDPPRGIFRLGIAYPIEARIEGHGVGAIRYCTFSTGSFVEPITDWEEPHRFAFDVTKNPPPM